jgi:hypothetical protein
MLNPNMNGEASNALNSPAVWSSLSCDNRNLFYRQCVREWWGPGASAHARTAAAATPCWGSPGGFTSRCVWNGG